MTAHLILASTSRYRKALLERLAITFDTVRPEVDERSFDAAFERLGPEDFALLLAREKALDVARRYPSAYVLGSDQLAVAGNPPALLHKPGTPPRAVAQLMALSGQTHTLVTGVVLVRPGGTIDEAVDVARLTMRPFGAREAEAYVEACAPLDCAGSYRIEDAGIALFDRIESQDYTGIIGLPLLAVCRLLRGVGLLTAGTLSGRPRDTGAAPPSARRRSTRGGNTS